MEHDSDSRKKAKHTFSREEAVEYLRRLADQLENGAIQIRDEEMEFEGLVKVKESLKSKKDKTSVKVQFKLAIQETPHEEPAAPGEATDQAAPAGEEVPAEPPEEAPEQPSSYKKLKKLMGKQFKELGEALEAGNPPDGEQVAAFFQSCQQMITFQDEDLGSENYPQFEAQAQALRDAHEAGDLEALRAAHAALKDLKKACHKQYK